MYCPSCGKQTPDQSVFCMSCGTRLDTFKATPSQTLNTRLPVKIGEVRFFLMGPVTLAKKETFWNGPQVGREGFRIEFELLDDKDAPTTYDGVANLNIRIGHRYTIGNDGDTKLKTKVSLNGTSFRTKPENGHPYYSYEHSAKMSFATGYSYDPHAEVEISFTPSGSKAAVFKKVSVSTPAQD